MAVYGQDTGFVLFNLASLIFHEEFGLAGAKGEGFSLFRSHTSGAAAF